MQDLLQNIGSKVAVRMNGWCSREDSRLTFIDQTFGSLSAVLAYAYDFLGPRRNGVRPRKEKGKYWL